MNKSISAFIISILLFSTIAVAQLSPPPAIGVKVLSSSVNPNVENVEVLLEDTSIVAPSYTLTTNENGDIYVNIDTLWSNWKFGHTIRATIIDCSSSPECVQTQAVRDEGTVFGVDFKFGVEEKFCPSVACEPTVTIEYVTQYVKCDIDETLDYGEVYGPDACNVKITAPPKEDVTTTAADFWQWFIGAGGLGALLLYFVNKYVPVKGKIKVERRIDRYGKPYIVVMKWSEYTRKDGTISHKWILVQSIKTGV